MKLLIIEENKGVLRLLHSILSGSGDDIRECTEGAEAVTLCALEQPDWMVLDLNLARVDGLTVAQQVRGASPQTRVLVMADEDDPRLRHRAVRAGVTRFVTKEEMIEIPSLLRDGGV